MKNKTLIISIILLAVAGLAYYGFYGNKNESLEKDMGPLKIKILKEGIGQEAKNGDTVFVHYTGTLENGIKFDSSLDRGKPFSFVLGSGQVIPGWEQGILGMKVGEKRKLTIAPELAYGSRAVGSIIQPNSTLIFEVEMLEIK